MITRQPGKNYPNQYEPITLEPAGDRLEIGEVSTNSQSELISQKWLKPSGCWAYMAFLNFSETMG
jgi:hypothetical protein